MIRRRRPSRTARVVLAALSVSALSALPLAGCGSDESSAAPETTVGATANAEVVLLDVRDPAEFAAGHLAGAVNYSYEQGALEAALADLDPSANYEVYCRSGRRSALATALLVDHGFTHVTDLGGIEAAAASTGLDVVVD